jgi:hypothetical protein
VEEDKVQQPAEDEGEETEGHRFEPIESEPEKERFASDEGEDVEGHRL